MLNQGGLLPSNKPGHSSISISIYFQQTYQN